MKFSVKAFVAGVLLSALFVCVRNIYSCELTAGAGRGVFCVMKKGSLDNLYIGSSMFRQGITLYNDDSDSFLLCYNRLDSAVESLILEHLLRNGLALKNLYVDMYVYSAARKPGLSDSRLMFDSPPALKFVLWDKSVKNSEGYISDSWEFFVKAGNDTFMLWPVYNILTAKRYYRGGYSADNFRRGLTPAEMKLRKPPEPEAVKMNPSQKESIIRIIELCRKYNVSLIFTETPKYEVIADNAEHNSLMNEYVSLLNDYGVKCIISCGTLNNINAGDRENIYPYDFPCEDTSMFQDYVHLSTNGSRKFMNVLREIQKAEGM